MKCQSPKSKCQIKSKAQMTEKKSFDIVFFDIDLNFEL